VPGWTPRGARRPRSAAKGGTPSAGTSPGGSPVDGRINDDARLFPREHLRHLIGHDPTGPRLSLDGRRPQVRRENDVRRTEEATSRGGLLLEHIDRRARNLSRPEGVRQRRLLDNLAACAVHEDRISPHLRELGRPDEAARLRRERGVNAEDVRILEQLLLFDETNPGLSCGGGGKVWVIR